MMHNRRTALAAVATAAFVLIGVLVPALPAAAIGVPPNALPECTGTASETGGWGLRDVVSVGTSATEPSPVRPRTARLNEPCFDDVGFSDPPLMIPVRMTDIEVPMLDEDEDDMDDGAPDVGDPDTPEWGSSGYGGTVLTVVGTLNREWRASSVWHRYRYICVQVTGSLTGLGAYLDIPAWSGSHTGINFDPSAGPGADRLVNLGPTSNATWSGSQNTPTTGSCPGTATHAIILGVNDQGGTNPTGTMWAPLDWPTSIQLAPTGSPGSGTGGEYQTAYTLGTAYYGGTQGAHYTFGAGSGYSLPDEGEVVCSDSYSAASTTSHPIEVMDYGGFSNLDRNTTPPVVVDGVATEWSTWAGYYPTDVGSGGVYLSNCPFLVSVRFWVCTFADHDPTQFGCVEVAWSADRWRDRTAYVGPDGDSPEEAICYLYPDTEGCYEVLNPPILDGTDFDVACAGAPEPTWAVWDWLFPWVGHMVQCLFVPLNGWDRLGWVDSAWRGGAGGEISDTLDALLDSLAVEGGCGLIMEGEVLGSDTAIDTCSWGWASTARLFLYWAFLITGCFAAVIFLMRTIFGLIDGRTPTPFDEDKN